MQTLIAHSHMMWSDVHNRWLSAREVLSLQGFPVHAHHVKDLGFHESDLCKLCSFNTSRASSGMPARNRSAMVRQAGDSMHVSVVGAALLWSAMYTEPSCTPGYFTRVLSDLAIQKVAQTQNSKRMFLAPWVAAWYKVPNAPLPSCLDPPIQPEIVDVKIKSGNNHPR